MTTLPVPPRPAGGGLFGLTAGRLAFSIVAAAAATAAVVVPRAFERPGTLSASWSVRIDSDGDGLTDVQESVLGTSPDQADTDLDGIGDLEEMARRTDPLDPADQPGSSAVEIGMFAAEDAGIVGLSSAVYVPPGQLDQLNVVLGVVLDGNPILFPGQMVAAVGRTLVLPASDGGHVAVVELPVPEWIVLGMGNLSFFGGASLGDPHVAGAPRSVDTANFASLGGVVMEIQDAPDEVIALANGSGGPGGGGVVYKPLSAGDDLPASLTSGQVCYQTTSPAGTNGASILYEVDSADCLPMDSYCSGADCSASVGRVVELPDPGALLGG